MVALLIFSLIGAASAANYMYEKANIKGVGYKNVEVIISTQHGFNGAKLVEKESGSGNVILQKMELEAERQLTYPMQVDFSRLMCDFPTGIPHMDYINFTKEAEFEYMPVSYQTGTYDQKWIEKLCVQNYRIGAVLTEMYTHAEHLQKKTEVKTRLYGFIDLLREPLPTATTNGFDHAVEWLPIDARCCTGVLEANLNAQVIGVAHIGWMSRDPEPSALVKGRHIEYGRSVEDLTGVFSIEKFIQLWGNSTCGAISVDWLPCL
ncbi:MAG: hypothetical protein A4E47_01701 [Methanosaeta sp. PtaU1.Bin028]|nr:MAG: hypothetical protein A4E47_01701 [Methanosaeta sp. PtaU1.Bin028]